MPHNDIEKAIINIAEASYVIERLLISPLDKFSPDVSVLLEKTQNELQKHIEKLREIKYLYTYWL